MGELMKYLLIGFFMLLLSGNVAQWFEERRRKRIVNRSVDPNHLDADGFLKEGYYEKYYTYQGPYGLEVNRNAVWKTREWHKQMQAAKRIVRRHNATK